MSESVAAIDDNDGWDSGTVHPSVPVSSAAASSIAPLGCGLVGRTNLGPLTLLTAHRTGLLRSGVPSTVRYDPPPAGVVGRDCLFRWQPAGGGRFELPLPADVAAGLLPLAAAADAQATVAAVADRLLELTAELHAAGWRLGLVDPAAVLVHPGPPVRLVLPDLGFAWLPDGRPPTPANRPDTPAWLVDPAGPSLYPHPRAVQQLASPAAVAGSPLADPAAGRRADLVMLARVFATLLTGRVGPAAGHPVLADVEAGKVTDASALRDRLRRQPLNRRELDGGGRAGPGGAGWLVGGLLSVALLAAGGLWLAGDGRPRPVAVTPATRAVDPDPPPPPTLLSHALAAVERDPAARPAARAAWRSQFQAACDALAADDPTVCAARMAALAANLERLRANPAPDPASDQEEQRWLVYCRQF